MKKIFITSLIATLFASVSINAFAAGKTTLSLDYAQNYLRIKDSDLKKMDHPDGINIKYRHEINHHLGIIGSFTHTAQEEKINVSSFNNFMQLDSMEISYSSLSVGPGYRFNDYISIYGLVGFARSRIEFEGKVGMLGIATIPVSRSIKSKNAFVYGAGVQFNPVKNLAIDVSYEYTKLSYKNIDLDDINIGSWMLGVGYRF